MSALILSLTICLRALQFGFIVGAVFWHKILWAPAIFMLAIYG